VFSVGLWYYNQWSNL